jgi:hypothetical protein
MPLLRQRAGCGDLSGFAGHTPIRRRKSDLPKTRTGLLEFKGGGEISLRGGMHADDPAANFPAGLGIDESDALTDNHAERRFEQATVSVDGNGEGMGLLAASFAHLKPDKKVEPKHDALTAAIVGRIKLMLGALTRFQADQERLNAFERGFCTLVEGKKLRFGKNAAVHHIDLLASGSYEGSAKGDLQRPECLKSSLQLALIRFWHGVHPRIR